MNTNTKQQKISELSYTEKIMLARKTNDYNILEILFKDNNLNIKTAILFNSNTPYEMFEKINKEIEEKKVKKNNKTKKEKKKEKNINKEIETKVEPKPEVKVKTKVEPKPEVKVETKVEKKLEKQWKEDFNSKLIDKDNIKSNDIDEIKHKKLANLIKNKLNDSYYSLSIVLDIIQYKENLDPSSEWDMKAIKLKDALSGLISEEKMKTITVKEIIELIQI